MTIFCSRTSKAQNNLGIKIPMHHQSAFTLIEMIVSIIIMIILMAIALPAWKLFLDRSQEDILQNQLLNAIVLAKSEANARHAVTALCKSQDQQSCSGEWQNGQLLFLDSYADGVIHEPQQILKVIQAFSHPGTIHWQAFPKYRHYLQFNPQSLRNDNGTFWHCHAQTILWAIMMNRAGRTRLVYPDQSGVIKGSHGKPLIC
jgi:Tfp pilus assembly protein FimT